MIGSLPGPDLMTSKPSYKDARLPIKERLQHLVPADSYIPPQAKDELLKENQEELVKARLTYIKESGFLKKDSESKATQYLFDWIKTVGNEGGEIEDFFQNNRYISIINGAPPKYNNILIEAIQNRLYRMYQETKGKNDLQVMARFEKESGFLFGVYDTLIYKQSHSKLEEPQPELDQPTPSSTKLSNRILKLLHRK